ncbi:unnamed protein product [Brachionus calyciflorus]|uniref:Uncharacterized protein n=1 Tax=Brachionus calyciflorus TaxID=104777 RepID=A0A814FBX8_9BILA|nr:unnamed protein product [Brachionus calyciflorus]
MLNSETDFLALADPDSLPSHLLNPNQNQDIGTSKNLNEENNLNKTIEKEENNKNKLETPHELEDAPLQKKNPLSQISEIAADTLITINLKISRLICKKGQKSSYVKLLLTDGNEFLEITSWELEFYKELYEGYVYAFQNYLALSIKNDQYFIKLNSNNVNLQKTSASKLTKIELKIPDPILCRMELFPEILHVSQALISFRAIVQNITTKKILSIININFLKLPLLINTHICLLDKFAYRMKCYDILMKYNIIVDIKNPEYILENNSIYDFRYFLLVKRQGLEIINCVFSEIKYIGKHQNFNPELTSINLSTNTIAYEKIDTIRDSENMENVLIKSKLLDVNLKQSNINMKFTDEAGKIFYANLFDIEKAEPIFNETDLDSLNKKLIDNLGKTFNIKMTVIKKKIDDQNFKTFYNIQAINN